MVKGVAHRALDQPRGFDRLQAALVLTLEFRLAYEDGDQRGATGHDVVGRQRGRALRLANAVRVIFEAAEQRRAEAQLMRAAVGRRDRVAIRMNEPVGAREPRDRPFDRAVLALFLDSAGERLVGHEFLTLDVGGEIVPQPAGEMECSLRRDFRVVADERGRAAPADLDAPEQIGLRARHLEHARGIKPRLRPENQGIRQKAHLGSAPVRRFPDDRQRARGLAAFERLAIERLTAGDFDFQPLGKRIHHRHADAMQSARGLVGAAVELAARMQLRHDDFERGHFGKFRVRVDRHAAPIVEHAQKAAFLERDFDEGCMAGDRFIHRIVDHFCEEVMQGVRVRPAHVHSRPPADGLEPLEHFDRGGGVVGLARSAGPLGLAFYWGGFAALSAAAPKRSFMCSFTLWRIALKRKLPRTRAPRVPHEPKPNPNPAKSEPRWPKPGQIKPRN